MAGDAAADPDGADDDADDGAVDAVELLAAEPEELDEQPATRSTTAPAARTLSMRYLQRD